MTARAPSGCGQTIPPHQLLLDRHCFGLTQACAPESSRRRIHRGFQAHPIVSRCGRPNSPHSGFNRRSRPQVSRRFRALGGKPRRGSSLSGDAQMGFIREPRVFRHRGGFLEVSCRIRRMISRKSGMRAAPSRHAGFLIVDDGVAQAATDAGVTSSASGARKCSPSAAPDPHDETAGDCSWRRNLLVLDQKALHEEWRIQPWTIEFAHEQSGRQIRRATISHLGTSMDTCFWVTSQGRDLESADGSARSLPAPRVRAANPHASGSRRVGPCWSRR